MEYITKEILLGMWDYFLGLEADLANTSRFVEPNGQETVYSFEFAKIIILSCTEVESVMKALCFEICGEEKGKIEEYKRIILSRYPKIVSAKVSVSRLHRVIQPFSEWSTGKLSWWDSYNKVKHQRRNHFSSACYLNAVTALSGLYILILYLAKTADIKFNNSSKYIFSDYSVKYACAPSGIELPDFQDS